MPDAYLPPDRLILAFDAYRSVFGQTVTIFGIPSDRYPEIVVVLREAIRAGSPLTDAEFCRALGMTMPPPNAIL